MYMLFRPLSPIYRHGSIPRGLCVHSKYLVRPAWIDAYAYDYCNDADSAEMLEIILDTRTYDPGYLWWSQYESSFSGFIENSQK